MDNIIKKFKMEKNAEGRNWPICFTGFAGENNSDRYAVTTNEVRASELHLYSRGAEGDAKLIAQLLNWYYTDAQNADKEINRL